MSKDSDRFLNRQPKHGNAAEKHAAKRLGARQTLASGALPFDRGDMDTATVVIDSKATVHKSISLKKDWLDKITIEATGKNKAPCILIQFVTPEGKVVSNGSWAVIPEYLFKDAFQ